MTARYYEMSEAAKILNAGIGRNKLFKLLREKRILTGKNLPYQQYIDRGYFRVIQQPVKWIDHPNLKTEVSEKGIDFLKKFIEGL